jgi:hypothetical protein
LPPEDPDIRELKTDIKWIRAKMEEVCKCNLEQGKDLAILKDANLPERVGSLETGLSSHVSAEKGADKVKAGLTPYAVVAVGGGCSLITGLIILTLGRVWP